MKKFLNLRFFFQFTSSVLYSNDLHLGHPTEDTIIVMANTRLFTDSLHIREM